MGAARSGRSARPSVQSVHAFYETLCFLHIGDAAGSRGTAGPRPCVTPAAPVCVRVRWPGVEAQPAIPALWRLSGEDPCMFEASLGRLVRPCLRKTGKSNSKESRLEAAPRRPGGCGSAGALGSPPPDAATTPPGAPPGPRALPSRPTRSWRSGAARAAGNRSGLRAAAHPGRESLFPRRPGGVRGARRSLTVRGKGDKVGKKKEIPLESPGDPPQLPGAAGPRNGRRCAAGRGFPRCLGTGEEQQRSHWRRLSTPLPRASRDEERPHPRGWGKRTSIREAEA